MTDINSLGFKWKQRLGFGSIEFGRGLVQCLEQLYLSIYLTTVAQLPLPALSVMFLVCKFIDAGTDVLVGALLDRTKSKIGRTKPWLYSGAVVYLIGVCALFRAPDFSPTGKIVYLYAGYIIYTLGMTMINIPEGALMASLTTEAKERTVIGAVRNVGQTIANSLIGGIVIPLVAFFGKGNDQLLGYSRTALFLGVLMTLLVVIGSTVTKEVVKPVAKPKSQKRGIGEALKIFKEFFCNKNFNAEMLLCFGNLLFSVAAAATMAYFCTYVLNGRMDLMALGFTVNSVVAFLTSFIAPAFNQKLTKKSITIIGAAIAAAGVLLRFSAISVPAMLIVGMGFIGLGSGLLGCMIQTTQPDIVDELAVKTGGHNAGLAMAMFSLACQIGVGVCNALITWVLNMGGFAGDAATQSASAITSINVVFVGIPLAALLIIIIGMSNYDLDKRYAEIQEQLKKMRAEEEK